MSIQLKNQEAKRERGWSAKKHQTQTLAGLRALARKDRFNTNDKWREVAIGVCDSNELLIAGIVIRVLLAFSGMRGYDLSYV